MKLQDIPLFKSLTDEELSILQVKLKRVEFKAGDTIIEEGEVDDTMYIFESGKVKITRKLTLKIGTRWGEAEKAMDILDAKQVSFCGEMSLVTGAPRSATITAITDCVLYTLSSKDLKEIAEKYQRNWNVQLDWQTEVLACIGSKEGFSHLCLAMMGPDYVQWHGFYEIAERFYIDLVKEAEDLMPGVTSDILAKPEHKWLKSGMTDEERAKVIDYYSKRYGENK